MATYRRNSRTGGRFYWAPPCAAWFNPRPPIQSDCLGRDSTTLNFTESANDHQRSVEARERHDSTTALALFEAHVRIASERMAQTQRRRTALRA